MTNSSSCITERLSLPYRCIFCLERCPSVYHYYGHPNRTGPSSNNTTSVLKLNQCKVCYQTVDPYCEREWLLVVLDLILLRQEAYRHVLCNFQNNCSINQKQPQRQSKSNNDDNSSKYDIYFHHHYTTTLRFWKEIVACCVLRVYHQFQSMQDTHPKFMKLKNIDFDSHNDFINDRIFIDFGRWFLKQFFISLISILVFTIVTLVCVIKSSGIQNNNEREQKHYQYYISMIWMSVLWPIVACQIATIWVEIWENSETTRFLGCSCLVVSYQWMALQQTMLCVTVRDNLYKTKVKPLSAAARTTLILTIAMIVRAYLTLLFLTACGLDPAEVLCPGLQWNLFSSHFSVESMSPRLCFTYLTNLIH